MVSTKKAPTILVGQETPSIFGYRYIVAEGRGCCAGDRGVYGIIGPCAHSWREDNNDVIFMYVEG